MEKDHENKMEENEQSHSSNGSKKHQATPITDSFVKKTTSREFWSSRGNIGEKINLLVGLNLLVVNLLSSLIQIIEQDKVLMEKLVPDLEKMQEFLSNMVTHPDSGLELQEKIEDISLKVTGLINEFSNVSSKPLEEKMIEIPENIVGSFKRNPVGSDKWGIIESIESLMSSYSNLSHLGFPNHYLVACKELLRYEILEEFSRPNHYDIIQIPSLKIKNLINKLLREAPAARLLQNLRRMFPLEDERFLWPSENKQIQDLVEQYYNNMTDFFKSDRSLSDSIRASKTILMEYNLGGGDLESRIPNVSFSVVKDIQRELDQALGNDFRQYILSETIILIHRLNDSQLQNERFVTFLRRLK
ncbi:MAG: hypothetical protein ACFE95_20945 [Candidatus Hodarchaeota archaeon]